MNENEIRALMLFINAGVKVLGARIMLLLSLLLTFGLFAGAAYDPSPYRLGGACGFALLVFLPLLRLDRAQAADRSTVTGEA